MNLATNLQTDLINHLRDYYIFNILLGALNDISERWSSYIQRVLSILGDR